MAQIFTLDNLLFMLDGLKMTIIISIATIFFSLIIGTFLALFRNYCKGKYKILSILAGIYIELFRCTPNLLWILMIYFTMKGNAIYVSIFTFTLFTSAVVAEIVRGGLNGIPTSQFEGAASQGFRFYQSLIYIILPQTYRSIIPALLSQVTTIIKDTSFLKAINVAEYMTNSSIVMGQYAITLPQISALYGTIAFTYFVLNFGILMIVRRYTNNQ